VTFSDCMWFGVLQDCVKSEKEESSATSSALASIVQTLKDIRNDSRLAMENERMRLKLKRLK
jgi:hypothetical protein